MCAQSQYLFQPIVEALDHAVAVRERGKDAHYWTPPHESEHAQFTLSAPTSVF